MDKNSSEKKSKWKVFLDTLQALDDDTLTTFGVIIVVIIILIISKFISVDSTDSIDLNFIIRFTYAAILLLLGGCAIAAVIFVGIKIIEATVDMIEIYKSVKSKNEIMEEAEKNNTIMAPVACKILKAYVTADSGIKKGQVLFIIEQSKMEMELVAPVDGTILSVFATVG